MRKDEILRELNLIFIDILDNENIILNENITAEDIEEWDSLAHIQLAIAIEKHFKIRFTTYDIQNWKNIGDLIKCIESKK